MPTPRPQTVAHFAINTDDVELAAAFYGDAFGWRADAWGPPGFLKLTTSSGELPGPIGALQRRRDLRPGTPVGVELTVAVEDLVPVRAAVERHGGTVLMEETTIPGVGEVMFFADPTGVVMGAMVYLPDEGADGGGSTGQSDSTTPAQG